MKYFQLLIFSFLANGLFSQVDLGIDQPIFSMESILDFQVVEKDQKLHLKYPETVSVQDLIDILSCDISDADILIEVNVTIPQDITAIRVNYELYNQTNSLLSTQREVYSVSGTYKTALEDVTENGLYLHESYVLKIRCELVASFVCETSRPEFVQSQKLLPGLTIGLGVAGLGISEIGLRIRQKDKYQTYYDFWEEGKVDAEVANPYLTSAVKTQKVRRFVTIGSGALIAGGAVWYWLNKNKVKKRQDRFDMFCDPDSRFSVSPDYSTSLPGESIGFKLTHRF